MSAPDLYAAYLSAVLDVAQGDKLLTDEDEGAEVPQRREADAQGLPHPRRARAVDPRQEAPVNDPAPASLPDLVRRVVALLDRYDAAASCALRCASEVKRLRPEIERALYDVADLIDEHAVGARWYARAALAALGVIETDAWSVELLGIAKAAGERDTEPGGSDGR